MISIRNVLNSNKHKSLPYHCSLHIPASCNVTESEEGITLMAINPSFILLASWYQEYNIVFNFANM